KSFQMADGYAVMAARMNWNERSMFLRAQSVDNSSLSGVADRNLEWLLAAYAHGAFETLVPLYDMQELERTITIRSPKYEISTAINALNKANLLANVPRAIPRRVVPGQAACRRGRRDKESIPSENPKSQATQHEKQNYS